MQISQGRMTRSLVLARSPILMMIFPFGNYDHPVNEPITKPLDEYGWDRVKRIYQLTYVAMLTF